MPNPADPTPAEHELVMTREIDVPRELLYRCFTDPALMLQWFTPKPWETAAVDLDVRAGGRCNITMRSPDGEEFPNRGIYLEVVPNERIITTDAYSEGWVPSAKPFMTAITTFEDLGQGRTRYTARARHWNAEDKAQHEQMGFEPGWNAAADQLVALAKTL